MCGDEKGSDVQGGWSRGKGSRDRDRFRGIGKSIGQLKKDGCSVDGKSFVSML